MIVKGARTADSVLDDRFGGAQHLKFGMRSLILLALRLLNFDKVKLRTCCAARHALGRLTKVQRKRVEGRVSRLFMGVGLKLHSWGSASIYCSVRSCL